MTNGARRGTAGFVTLDDYLESEGKRMAFQVVAIAEALAHQSGQATKDQKLSRKRLADRIGPSRS